jgi:hypothetical protein
MNISRRDTKLLLILFGIVSFLLLYFLVFDAYTLESEKLLDDIDYYSNRLSRLNEAKSEAENFDKEIEASRGVIFDAQSGFPANIFAEDLIMYALELRDNTGITPTSIAFVRPVAVAQVKVLAPDEHERYSLTERNAYRTGINLNSSFTYQQLKDLADYIADDDSKTALNSVSVSYNPTTGLLHGNIVIYKYIINTGESEYIPAQIEDMPVGLPNPFGIIT